MHIKTPKFWLKKNIISYLLLPLSILYFLGSKLVRFVDKKEKIQTKIICVGNLIAGGSGKTPVALAIGKILQKTAVEFAYLSKGYGGRKYFMEVTKNSLASEVGDEPLILADSGRSFVAKNRFFGAKKISEIDEIEMIIMDDGLQNNALYKDFSIVVVDGDIGFGNGFLLPAGPLREQISQGLKRADMIVLIGSANDDLKKNLQNHQEKIISAKIIAKNLDEFYGENLFAFCGIAYPKKFFSFLETQGLKVVQKVSFPDHYFYKNSDLENLIKRSEESNLKLITTKKDFVKFPKNLKEKIKFLDIELKFSDEDFLRENLFRC
jgi:tetraacyldisaccharide 4'-kinase